MFVAEIHVIVFVDKCLLMRHKEAACLVFLYFILRPDFLLSKWHNVKLQHRGLLCLDWVGLPFSYI